MARGVTASLWAASSGATLRVPGNDLGPGVAACFGKPSSEGVLDLVVALEDASPGPAPDFFGNPRSVTVSVAQSAALVALAPCLRLVRPMSLASGSASAGSLVKDSLDGQRPGCRLRSGRSPLRRTMVCPTNVSPGRRFRVSLAVRSFSFAKDSGLSVAAVPLTHAAWLSLLFGVVPAWRYCNVRPSKSLCTVV